MIISTPKLFRLAKVSLLLAAFFYVSHASAQLTGTKNVPGDYATLGAAIAAVNSSGVGTGGLTINVIAGNAQTAPVATGTGSDAAAIGAGYVIKITSNAPTASNPLTINGNGNTVTASGLATASNYNDAIFTIAGTSYVTINNFIMNDNAANTTVAASNNKTEIGVAIVRGTTTTLGSQYNTVSNCTITLGQGAAYTNTIGIYVNSSNSFNVAYATVTAATSAAGANSYNSFYRNTISGVTSGITLIGTAAFNDVGNVIGASGQGNTITLTPQTANMTMTTAWANYLKTRQDGVFLINNNSFFVSYNSIRLATGGTTNTPNNGIFASTSASGAYTNTINFNTVSLTTATAAIALNGIQNTSGNSSASLKINNNTIKDTATTGTNIGISNTSAATASNINNNNVRLSNTTGSITGITNSGAVTTDNITFDTVTGTTTTGGIVGIVHITGAVTNLTMTNNRATLTSGAVVSFNLFGIESSGVITNLDMSSNNVSFSTACINSTIPIYLTGGPYAVSTVNNNTTSCSFTSAGTAYGFRSDAGHSTSLNANNNNITITGSGATGTTIGMYNNGKDTLIRYNNNTITISGSAGVMRGIENVPASLCPSQSFNYNTFNLSTAGSAGANSMRYINSSPTNPDAAGIVDSICYNTLSSTSGFTNTTGQFFFIIDQFSNPTENIIGNKTSGTITKTGTGTAATLSCGIRVGAANAFSAYNTTTIAQNRISNVTVGSTDPFMGIYCAISSAQVMIINDDTVMNNTAGSNDMQGIAFDFCAAGTNIYNNYISGNTGTAKVSGISTELTLGTSSANVFGANIYNNKIINLSSSGASGEVYGIMDYSTAPANVVNIYNDSIANLSVSGNTTPLMYGIYQAGNTTASIYNNVLNGFTSTTTSGNANVNGIYSLSGTTVNIYKNKMYSMNAGTSGGAATQLTGINLASAASTYNVYNNFVTGLAASSSNNPNSIIGLFAQSNGSTFNVYYNTIGAGINGSPITSSATNFGAAGVLFGDLTSTVLTLKDNIVTMNVTPKGTGISACVQRNVNATAFTPASSSFFKTNNNIYYTNSTSQNYLYVDDITGGAGTAKNGYALSGLTPDGTNNIANESNFNFCNSAYKTFMGSGRESSTFTENNLVAGGTTGTFAPSGSSYAYGTGVAVTSPSITTDFNGATRTDPPHIGALQFTGSAASLPPVINFTPLNAISYCVAVPPTLTATITSTAGVDVTAGTKPRLYYKGSADADAYGGANNSTFDGWKYVEANNTSSPFTFTINYALLNHTAGAGTVMSYFVIAQDVSGGTLVGYSAVAFASGYCPTSVALTGGAAPTGASPVVNTYTITALPSFTASVAPTNFCGIDNATVLTVSPSPADLQIQWAQDFGTGSYTSISGATTNGYGATPPSPPAISTPSASNVYRAQLSCNASVVATSSTATATDFSPQVLTTTPAARCGTGSVTLGATGSTGSVLQWYAASTGGYPLGTGTSFATPSIAATTTYYVADSFGSYGNPQSVGETNISGPTLFAPGATGSSGINFTVNTTCIIQSVKIYAYNTDATATGAFTISVYSGSTIIASYSDHVAGAPGGGTSQVVPVNFYLTPGTYKMAYSAVGTNANLMYGSSTNAFPYSTNFNTIALNSTTFSPYYFYYYDWKILAGCKSTRTAVTATINPLPTAGTVSATPNPICVGSSLTLSETGIPSGSGTMVSYAWSGPSSFSNTATATSVSSAVFSPTNTAQSGVYSLTVTYPGTGCTSNPVTTSYVTVNSTGTATLGGTTNACVGAASILTTSITGGTWTSSNSALATVDPSTGTVTGVAAGSPTISYTTPCGALSTIGFTVNTTPSAITGLATICTLATTTLNNSVGGGTWTSGVTSVASINSSTGAVNSTATTGVTIITYTIGSCTANFTLTVGSSSPAAITGTTSACVGASTTLADVTGGGVWSSSATATATINSSTGVYYGVSNGSATITYSTGCGSAATTSVTINGTTVSATNSGPVCTGTTLNLTGTVGASGTYSWTGPNGFTSASLSPSVSSATSLASGVYSLAVTSGGCTNSTTTYASVDSLSSVSANATPATVCVGGSSTLTGAGGPSAFSVISVPYALTSFTPTGTLTSASGWSADNDDGGINVAIPFTFNFYGTNYSTVNVSANGYVNFGSLITSGNYTAASLPSSSGGVPRNAIFAFWHDTKVTSGNVTYGTTGVSPNRKFIISYNAIPDGGSAQTNSAQIILYETSNNVDVMITKTSTVYAQTCGVQNSTGTSGLTPPSHNNSSWSVTASGEGWRFETPSYNYTWSPATSLSSTTVAAPVSTGLGSTQIFTVTAVDAYSGCTTASTNSATLTVVAQPSVMLSATPAALCTGGDLTLTATPSGGTGTATYTWIGPGLSSTTGSTPTPSVFHPTVGATATGAYTVSLAYSGAGCNTASGTSSSVTVATQPVVTVSPSGTTLCLGDNLVLTESTTSGGAGTPTYTWSGPGIATTTGSSATSPTFSPTVSTGAYSVSVAFTGSNCSTATNNTATVTVNTLPGISVGATPSICMGATSTNISYSAAVGSPTTYDITWDATALSAGFSNVTGASLPGGNIPITVPGAAAANTYNATLTVSNGICTSSSYTIHVNVIAYPSAAVTSAVTPCSGYSTNVVVTGTSGATIYYSVDSGSSSLATLTGGTYNIVTGAITAMHSYQVISVQNAVCTTAVDTNLYITPIPMQWVGGASGNESNWTTAANWSCGFVPGASDITHIPFGTTYSPVIAASDSGFVGNLIVDSAASLTIGTGAVLHVRGNLTNNTTIAGAGTLMLDNTSAQSVYGIGSVRVLELNNTAGATVVASARLTVDSLLTVTAGTLNTGDSVVLNSTALVNARIGVIPPTGAAISGNVKINQYVEGGYRRFRFISHPFSSYIPLSQIENFIDITGVNGASNGFTSTASNAPSAFRYDPTVGNSSLPYDIGWRPFTSAYATADSNRLHKHQGIRLFFRGAKGEGLGYAPYVPSATTFSIWGPVNQGPQTVVLSKGGSSLQDYNMVGNPYASPVDIGTIVFNALASGNIVGPVYYVWNPSLGAAGQYQALTIGTMSATPYYMQANCAFQVRAAHNGDTLNFTESNKNAAASNTLLKALPQYVSLMVYDANYHPWDMLYLQFNKDATDYDDVNLDGGKPSGADFNFYALSAEKHRMVLDARPYQAGKVIPLGIGGNYAQDFIIRAEGMAVPDGGKLYLHDKLLQQYVLLQQGTEYRFAITSDKATQGDDRFELKMEPAEAIVANKGLQVTMTPNPATDDVNISFAAASAKSASIRILDLSGVSVYNRDLGTLQNGNVNVSLSSFAAGVYMVELTSGNEKVVQRLVKE